MTPRQHHWFLQLLEGMVSNLEVVMFNVRRTSLGLEIVIKVAPEDEEVFTTEILEALRVLVGSKAKTSPLLIYLEGKEPREVLESFM